jgi:hypothetical protein
MTFIKGWQGNLKSPKVHFLICSSDGWLETLDA